MYQILLGRGGQQAGVVSRRIRSKVRPENQIPYSSLHRQGAAWTAGGFGVASTLFGVYRTFNSMRFFKYIK
ncbi:hypothetical protein ASPVEDRAFT_44614 [Aspergillus versicolor CBS 583.65]|uniref:Uncharacterized protein n=1 Tax=Aspergillus versicolor CBS 583.65 TaxID=1036611 RepID=A0A1L9PU34_ASPVE|nr:uncharacterized protein ASPVEDRAFT_44614 [Aspergillus versicolor CBS 583.65]OJJ05070.1 hypothetical protein ASPVEDRAFT_44614 [Aspergillus versicolor CBS 583.65]